MSKDPTYHEMRSFLEQCRMTNEHSKLDMEEAIYWYAVDHHGGQTTNLYAAVSSLCPFKPSLLSRGVSEGPAMDLYIELQLEYGGA